MTTTILLFCLVAVLAFGAGAFGTEVHWRRRPANVSERELRALQLLWQHGPMRARRLVELADGKVGMTGVYALLGDLAMRELVVWHGAPDLGAIWTITTEGLQICALNQRLSGIRERTA